MEISEFQKLMYELYAHNDRRRGAKLPCSGWLKKLENLPKLFAEKSLKMSKKSWLSALPGYERLPISMEWILKKRL